MNKTIYALGFFDGVHLGHAALLRACRCLATEYGWGAGVVTFGSHPDALVLGKTPELINTVSDRERLLKSHGMDRVVTLPFDENMRALPWRLFLELLTKQYGAAGFVVGEDFRFGFRGEGTACNLMAFCEENNLPCSVVPQQTLSGTVISSTYIRGLLQNGEMEKAAAFLGHPHILTGTVVSGRQLGRTIGIPTANLLLPRELLIPKFGVYACLCSIDKTEYPAVTNIGTRPTVGGHRVTVEPWILDFQGDLYGKTLTLKFYKFLRPERKFPDLNALRCEIQKNGEETRKFFQKG